MLSIKPSASSGTYQLPLGTIFDEDVSVWTLVRYIFKVMFAFIIVNFLLTVPVLLVIIFFVAAITGSHLPRDFSR